MITAPLLAALALAASADVVTLANGDTMRGIVVSKTRDSIKLKLGEDSEVELPASAVASVWIQSENEDEEMRSRWRQSATRERADAEDESQIQALMDGGLSRREAEGRVIWERLRKANRNVRYARAAEKPRKAKPATKAPAGNTADRGLEQKGRKSGFQLYEGEWMSAEEIAIHRKEKELDAEPEPEPRTHKVARKMVGSAP